MLFGVREDESSELASFSFRPKSRELKSGCKIYLDMLKKKLKQIQGPKIKFPEPLVEYLMKKKNVKNNETPLGFPGIEDVIHKFKRPATSSLGRRTCIDREGKRFMILKQQHLEVVHVNKV